MLIGLAIDYGVHLITRYEEELRRGRSERAAMDKAIVYTGQGIFTGCFTTAGAFFAMSLTNFQGIKEMGLITGGGMVICLIPMLTLLPVLLMRGKQNLLDEKSGELALKEASLEGLEAGGERVDARARLEQLWLDRPWAVIGVTASLCIVAALFLPKVRFDYNLLNMQSDGLAAVLFEHKLVDSSEKSVLYGAVVATNLEEAVRLEQQLTNLPSVHSSDSMSKYLAERSDKKLALIREIKATTAPIVFPEPDPAPENLKNLGGAFRKGGNLTSQHQRKAGKARDVWAKIGRTQLPGRCATKLPRNVIVSVPKLVLEAGGVFVEVFAGHEALSAAIAKLHARWMHLACSGRVKGVHFGIPCTTWSALWTMNGGTRRASMPLGDGSCP
jgi:hypothetical protein